MTDPDVAPLVAAYLDGLADAGITLRAETAEAMIRDRVTRLATGLGLSQERAVLFYDGDLMRSWAREAAAELRDEQPGNALLAAVPTALAPLRLVAGASAALTTENPALARMMMTFLSTYPAIVLGGVALVRCPAAVLLAGAAALSSTDSQLSQQLSTLATAQQ